MITIDIFGGLGNQMFQYALGRHLAIKNGSDLTLRFIDVGAFSKREYVLGCFKLAQGTQVKKAVGSRQEAILGKLRSLLGREEPLVREKGFPFDPKVLELKGDIHLHGYWQSEKYFAEQIATEYSPAGGGQGGQHSAEQIATERQRGQHFKDIREILLEDFTFIKPLSRRNQKFLGEIENSNSISVHVRRGDYVIDQQTNKFHGVCGPDYYRKAVEIIAKMVRQVHHKPVFYFFSDDIKWVKNNLSASGGKNVYVDWNNGDQSFVDMQLISHCKHHILANSSFSWWGAWLNRNPKKIVIAPAKWFQDDSIDTRDLIPKEWVKI